MLTEMPNIGDIVYFYQEKAVVVDIDSPTRLAQIKTENDKIIYVRIEYLNK